MAVGIMFLIYSIFIILISWNQSHDIKNPALLFNLVWFIVVLLRIVNTMDWYEISDTPYIIIFMGSVFFNLGCALSSHKIVLTGLHCSEEYVAEEEEYYNTTLLLIIQLALMIVTIPMLLRAVTFIGIYGWHDMRTIYANGIEYGYMTAVERVFYIHLGVFPLTQTCFYLQAVLWGKGKVPFWHVLIGLINVCFTIIITVGRWDFAYIFIALLFSALLNKRNVYKDYLEQARSRNRMRFIYLIALIVAVALIMITIQRHDLSSNIFQNIISIVSEYFCCGIQLLDKMIANPSESGLDTLLFGGAFLHGVLSVISYIMQTFSGGSLSLNVVDLQAYAGNFFTVGDGQQMNAYVTWYYYFMRDFGYVGVIISSVLLGYVFSRIYRNVKENESIKNQLIYIHMVEILLFCSLWWEPMRTEVAARILHNIWLIPLLKVHFSLGRDPIDYK